MGNFVSITWISQFKKIRVLKIAYPRRLRERVTTYMVLMEQHIDIRSTTREAEAQLAGAETRS